jgi:hypothetical protein
MSKLSLLGALLLFAGLAAAQELEQQQPQHRVLVWIPQQQQQLTRIRQRMTGSRSYASIPILSGRLTPRDRAALEAELGPGSVIEDREYRTSLLPSTNISGVPAFWDAGYTGRSQSVATIDTGVNPQHPTFFGVNVVSKVYLNSGKEHPCFGDDASSGNDLQGHGTRSASILASQAIPSFPNYFGAVRGVGTIYSMKAGFRARPGSSCPVSDGILMASDIVAALDAIARETDAKVVNLSFGSLADADDDPLARVFDYFADRYGMTLVCAVGNRGTERGIDSPAISYNGIAIANIDDKGTEDKRDDSIHPSSTRGPTVGQRSKPDLAAPGTRIWAAEFNSIGFNQATGTSAAAPLVAGAAVLLRDAGLTSALSVKALLLNSTDGNGVWLRDWGWGGLNAAAAFEQRRNVLTGSLRPRSSMFFRGTIDGPFRATLVWSRHVDVSSPTARSPLNELALAVFRRDGTLVAESDSQKDNVESVRVDAPSGDYVFRVQAPGSSFALGVEAEEFALAVTRAGLAAASGPKWEMRCAMPSAVSAGASFIANCTAENTGDIDLLRVTGSLLVPQGFAGGGPQSFGSLAPGQSRTLEWNLTAANFAGSFQGTTSGMASAFGLNVDFASTLPRVDVVAAATVATDPGVVTLTSNTRTASVRISGVGGGTPAVSAPGAPWFQLSPVSSNGTITISLTDAARSLAAGRYESSYSVTATNGTATARGTVVLVVSAPLPAIESARVTAQARMVAGCPQPEELRAISDAVSPVFWFVARGVKERDQLTVRWTSPAGAAVETANLPPVVGESCFAATLDLSRIDPTRRYGEWKVEATWNGVRQPATAFVVNPALQLTGSGCDESSSTARILVCPQFQGSGNARGQLLRLEFVRPDSEVDGRAEALWDGATRFAYTPAVPSAGDWQVRVFSDAGLAATLDISVPSTGVVLKRAEIMEGRTVELAFDQTAEGSTGRLELLNPEGTVVDSKEISAAEASVELPALEDFGRWRIRISWDGIVLRTLSFERLPARILEQGLTADTRQPLCPGTSNASVFSVLDPAARLWVRLDGVQQQPGNGQAAIEFRQSGETRARAEFGALSGGGSCVSAALPVSGSVGAKNPGPWEARVLVGGVELSRVAFEIRRDSKPASEGVKAAPLSGPGAVVPVRGETGVLP